MRHLLKLKSILILTLLFLLTNIQAEAGSSELMSIGEELEYEVSFLGIGLGKIKILIEGQEDLTGLKVYKTKGYMDSYSGIPFVDLHAIFESWIDPSVAFSHQFIGHMKVKGIWNYQKILFDYKNKKVFNEKWKKDYNFFKRTIESDKKWSDGLSLFFLARRFTNSKKNLKIPTIADKDTVYTTINFSGKKVDVDIDAVKYPIKTIYFNGAADWTGIYGLTGRFEGWFSDDEASIPIKAKMNVYVGSIDIELVKWNRKGWKPPKSD